MVRPFIDLYTITQYCVIFMLNVNLSILLVIITNYYMDPQENH